MEVQLLRLLQQPIECVSTIIEDDPLFPDLLRFIQTVRIDLSGHSFHKYHLQNSRVYLLSRSHPFRGGVAPLVVECDLRSSDRKTIRTYTFIGEKAEALVLTPPWVNLPKQ